MFQSFRLDTVNQCLWHGKTRASLTPKAFDVLRYLVEHAGRLVPSDEILAALWPDTYVNPEGLRGYVQEIRKVLGDRPDKPIYIETRLKRGYQFIAPVTEESMACPLDLPTETAKKIVGREAVLAELERCLSKAARGQRQIVFVTGEPGIGKTALADEFQRRAAADAHSIRIARGQCVEGYGGKEAYYPMLEALGGLCRGPGGESVVQTLAEQAPTWLVQFPALVKPEHREMLKQEIDGATRERMVREICEVLEASTSEYPLLLVFEDLHWADSSSIDLISAVARRRAPAKLMVIGTYRPVDVIVSEHPLRVLKQDLLVHQLCHEIGLEPLSEAEVAEYLVAESAGASLPESLASLLYQHSEGNPLFMLTVLDDMTARGLISRNKGSWQLRIATKGIDLEVPESLQQMIEAQIERMSTEEKRVLEVVSLDDMGRFQFGIDCKAAVIDLEPEKFEEVCETLSRRHCMLRPAPPVKLPDGTVTACYEFVHALYRKVSYRRIAPGRRARLHRRLGNWIEESWEHRDEAAECLAHHFEAAGDWPRAIRYLRLAADAAERRYEARQAAEILEHALELVRRLPEAERAANEIEVLEKLGALYSTCENDPEVEATRAALPARAGQCGLLKVRVRTLLARAHSALWTGSQQGRPEIVEQILRLSAFHEDALLAARTRAHCFALRVWTRWSAQDAAEFRDAIAEIQNAGDRRILTPCLIDCGFMSWISSEYREAHRNLMESRVIQLDAAEQSPYQATAYRAGQAIVPLNLLLLGEWGEALREIKEATAMWDRDGEDQWRQAMQLQRACVHLHAMDFAGVLAICDSALPLAGDGEPRPAPDHPTPVPSTFRNRLVLVGSAETALGNYESALEHLLTARVEMDRRTAVLDWYWRMRLDSALTELWLAKGDLSQARTQAERFLDATLATAEHTWQTLAWEANARVALAELDLTRAQECIAKGLSTMEGFEVPLAAWRLHATAAELYQRMNRRAAAKKHRELSRATMMKLANSLPSEEPLRQTFLSAPAIRKILGGREIPYPLARVA